MTRKRLFLNDWKERDAFAQFDKFVAQHNVTVLASQYYRIPERLCVWVEYEVEPEWPAYATDAGWWPVPGTPEDAAINAEIRKEAGL
jgi:hypothetical protein